MSGDDLSEGLGVESTETAFADQLLRIHREALDELIREQIDLEKRGPNWEARLRVARSELDLWEAQSQGRKQNYSSEELAEAQIARAVANAYEEREYSPLQRMNGEHQAQVAVNIKRSGLAERMIEEGKQGRKLSVLEISSRLAPVLTFPGSSKYFEMFGFFNIIFARFVLFVGTFKNINAELSGRLYKCIAWPLGSTLFGFSIQFVGSAFICCAVNLFCPQE